LQPGAAVVGSETNNVTEPGKQHRNAVLEMRQWTFATVRYKSTSADKDAFDLQYKHLIPVGWLSVKRAFDDVNSVNPNDWTEAEGWRVESGFVLTAGATVYLWGLERVVDTAKFSPLFVQALAARLAMDAAIPLTDDQQLLQTNSMLFAAKLKDAETMDGLQGGNEKIKSNSYAQVRGGGRHG
jgi:hypothetical protein